MTSVAYWISPKGEIFEVKKGKHITEVIANPEKFGFTTEFIEYVYNFYNEKIGQEGKAREQLMVALFNQGWIRIRKYKNFWSINLKVLAGKTKMYVTKWAQKILKGLFGYRELDPFMPVKIDQKDKPIKEIELAKMAKSDKFIPENTLIECVVSELENRKPLNFMNEFKEKNKKTFKKYLTESSLSRLWKHNFEHDCGAMTAFRKYHNCGYDENNEPCDNETPIELTKKENQKRNLALAADLKKMGYGVTKIIGKYPEGGSSVKEISYFIVDLNDSGNLKSDLLKLGKKYNQDSILFIPTGAIDNKSQAKLYGTNNCCNNWLSGGKSEVFNKGKIGVNSPIYTSYVNGRPFIFESCEISDILFGSRTTAIMANKFSKEY